MRLILSSAALLLLPLASAPAQPLQSRPDIAEAMPACTRTNVHPAWSAGQPRPRKLGELPPADLLLAVVRKTDGCLDPVIVRHGIGAAADRAPPSAPVGRAR